MVRVGVISGCVSQRERGEAYCGRLVVGEQTAGATWLLQVEGVPAFVLV
jgi:hypothetical protein